MLNSQNFLQYMNILRNQILHLCNYSLPLSVVYRDKDTAGPAAVAMWAIQGPPAGLVTVLQECQRRISFKMLTIRPNFFFKLLFGFLT